MDQIIRKFSLFYFAFRISFAQNINQLIKQSAYLFFLSQNHFHPLSCFRRDRRLSQSFLYDRFNKLISRFFLISKCFCTGYKSEHGFTGNRFLKNSRQIIRQISPVDAIACQLFHGCFQVVKHLSQFLYMSKGIGFIRRHKIYHIIFQTGDRLID